MTPLKPVTLAYWITSHPYHTLLFNMLYSNDQSRWDTNNVSCLVVEKPLKCVCEVYDSLAGSGCSSFKTCFVL